MASTPWHFTVTSIPSRALYQVPEGNGLRNEILLRTSLGIPVSYLSIEQQEFRSQNEILYAYEKGVKFDPSMCEDLMKCDL